MNRMPRVAKGAIVAKIATIAKMARVTKVAREARRPEWLKGPEWPKEPKWQKNGQKCKNGQNVHNCQTCQTGKIDQNGQNGPFGQIDQIASNMSDFKNFCEKEPDCEGVFIWNGHIVTRLGGKRVRIRTSEYDFNPDFQIAISNTHLNLNKMSDNDELIFNDTLQGVDYKHYKSNLEKNIKNDGILLTKNSKIKLTEFQVLNYHYHLMILKMDPITFKVNE